MSAPPPSQKDAQQVLKYAFDDAKGKLRVDAVISPSGTDLEIHHEDDSIAIGTSTDLFTATTIGPKIGLDVNVISPITVDTTGLATSANQLTEISSLASIDSKLTSPITVTGPLTDAELRATPVLVSATFTPSGTQDVNIVSSIELEISNDSGNPVPINGTVTSNIGTTNGLALDTTLTNNTQTTQLVNATGNATAIQTLSTTPTGSDYGLLTNALLYGLTTAGGGGYVPVKVNPSGTITADVTGSVTANAGTNLNTSALALDSTVAKDASLTTINTSINTLLKPANTLTAVTTLGTITNVVHVDDNSGSLTVDNNGTFPVQASIAAAQTLANVTTLGTITNVVHVDDNSGSLTVDNNGTFVTQATLAAETTKVIGTVNIAAAQTLATVTTVGAVTAITNALPAGTNALGTVGITSSSTATLTNVNSSAASVSLLASTAGRKGAVFFNDSSKILYLKFGATASLTSYTVQIPALSYFELPLPIYTGAIDGIWAAANGAVRITELT